MGPNRFAEPLETADAVLELLPRAQALVVRILGRSRNDPDVEDCVHEVFRRALEGADRIRDGQPTAPWLLGIARHVALDSLRSRHRSLSRRAPRSDDDAPGEEIVQSLPDLGSGPEDLAAHGQGVERLRIALERLPEGQRRALLLFHVDGLRYREIAARLGVPAGTVGIWVLRARQALAAALDDEDRSRRGEVTHEG